MGYMMIYVQCVDEELCRDCEELDITAEEEILFANNQKISRGHNFHCRHYESCERVAKFLKKKAINPKNEQQEEI